MKKLFLAAFAVCCITFMIAVVKTPVQAATSGTCGANLTWTLNDAGKLTISGKGRMTEFATNDRIPWYYQRNQIKSVVIEEGVESIGEYAFYECKNVASVSMPSTLTYVGGASFIYTAVTDIQIPDSVTEIDTHAFKYCKKLKSIKLPAGIKTVPMHVLYGCTSLTSVTIPSKVKLI